MTAQRHKTKPSPLSVRWRWAREYLNNYSSQAPLTTVLMVLAIVAVMSQLLLGKQAVGALLLYPGQYGQMWTPFTGLFLANTPLSVFCTIVLLACTGPLAERALGSLRYALTAAASYLLPLFAVAIAFSLAQGLLPAWAQSLADHPVYGLPFAVVGSLLAASRGMAPVWRRRVRLLTCLTTLVLLGFGGSMQDLGLFLAALTGWVCGVFFLPAPDAGQSLVGTRHESRTLVSLAVAAIMLGSLFAAHIPHPLGPLAAAQFDISTSALSDDTLKTICAQDTISLLCDHEIYLTQTRGLVPSILALFPVLLQLILAVGLARGRRLAARATLVLQGTILFFAALRLLLYSGALWEHRDLFGRVAELEDAGNRLLVPVLIPAALMVLIMVTWRLFPLPSDRSAIRGARKTLALVTLIGTLAMVLVAALFPQGFSPRPDPLPFVFDYLTRLLPSAAWYVLPPEYTGRFWLTALPFWVLPLLFWATLLVCIGRIFMQPAQESTENRNRFIALVKEHGAGTLGWISTWDNRRYWISPSGQEGFAYLEHGGVALTVGDPAAAPDRVDSAVREFAHFCTESGLAPALYSVHPPTEQAAAALGWSSWQVAEEAVIDLGQLTFSGKKFQSIRTALNQAKKQGINHKWTSYKDLKLGEWAQIVEISEGWVSEKSLPEMGFTLGGLEELKDPDTRILLALDQSGFVHGVTSWMPVHSRGKLVGLTLDFMRRREGDKVFPASMEFLIASAAQDARAEGLELLSLSGAPLAHSLALAERSGLDRLLDYLGQYMEPLYGFRSLLTFKAKFRPCFEPMYLVTPDSADLPAIGIAVTHAYLPEMKARDVLGILQAISSTDRDRT